jgi:hypothetical protein
MKRFHFTSSVLAVAFAVAILLTGCGGGGVATPEEMADKLVAALGSKDKAAFDGLLIQKGNLKNLMSKAEMPEDIRKEQMEKLDEEFSKMGECATKEWESALADLKEAGLEGALKVDGVEKNEEERKGTKGAEVKVNVSAGDKKAVIEFTTVNDGKWFLLPDVDVETEEAQPATEEIMAPTTGGDSIQ